MRRVFPALVAGALIAVQGASGQTAPPPFDPTFVSTTLFPSGTVESYDHACAFSVGAQSTISFTITGLSGDEFYAGTFRETATARVETVEVEGQTTSGRLVDYDATFTVEGAGFTATGEKHLIRPSTIPNGSGCYDVGPPFENQDIGAVNSDGYDLEFTVVITTPEGTFTDTGISRVNAVFAGSEGTQYHNFQQRFDSREEGPAVLEPVAVDLTPPVAVNPVATSHTVTATAVTATGNPAEGATITFNVTGTVTADGSCTTNAHGQCDFTYTGPTFPGADAITACADSDEDGQQDPDEPCDEATKQWVFPVSTPGHVTGGGQVVHADSGKVNFGLTFRSDGTDVLRGECLVNDSTTGTKLKCVNVLAFVQAGNTATVYGNAEVNDTQTLYKLVVTDNGEGNLVPDIFSLVTAAGYAVAGPVMQGNVQVHD